LQHPSSLPIGQHYVEDLVISRIGDTRAEKAAALVPESTSKHTIEKMYVKSKTCHECALAAQSGERRAVTKFGCRECEINLEVFHYSKNKVILQILSKLF
jgi:hypothetical protein